MTVNPRTSGLARAVACAVAGLLAFVGVVPSAAADGWEGSVSVTVSKEAVDVSAPTSVVTASLSTALVSPYWLGIYDSTGQLIALCDYSEQRSAYNAACEVPTLRHSVTVSVPTNATRQYTAYVTAGQPPSAPPTAGVVAVSQPVSVTNTGWNGHVSLTASATSLDVDNTVAVLTATVDTKMAGPYWLSIYDSAGEFVGGCDGASTYWAVCTTPGLGYTVTVSVPANTTRTFTAFVSQLPLSNGSVPVNDVRAISEQIALANSGWHGNVTLTASSTSLDANNTTAVLTATVDSKMAGPYWLSIYDSAGGRVGGCDGASTYWNACTTPGLGYVMSVSVPADSTRTYIAYVSQSPFGNEAAPANDVRATSDPVTIVNAGWNGTVELTIDRDEVDVHHPTAELTAEVGTQLGGDYWLSIYDATTGERIAQCDSSLYYNPYTATCNVPGYSKSVSITVPTNGTKSYVAYVTKGLPPLGGLPANGVRASSNTISIANTGWTGSVQLEVSPGEVSYLHPTTTIRATVTPALAGDYYLSIYDEDGTPVAVCDASEAPNYYTAVCDVPRVQLETPADVALGDTRSFTAYVSRGTPPAHGLPTNDVRAVSSTRSVYNRPWAGMVSLDATSVNGQAMLVMTASPELTYPYWIAVYDEKGKWAAGCAAYSFVWYTTEPFLRCEPHAGGSLAMSPIHEWGTYTAYVTLDVPTMQAPPTGVVAVSGPVTPDQLGPLLADELDGGFNPSEGCFQACHGDPVNSMTGEFFETNTDLSVAGTFDGLRLERNFSTARRDVAGMFGYGWSSNLDMSLGMAPGATGTSLAQASQVVVRQENGSLVYFSLTESGYVAAPRVRATLIRNGDGSFTFTRRAEESFRFSAQGQLERIEDRNGLGVDLARNAQGRITSLSDGQGRTIELTWVDGRVATAADQAGREVQYAYDGTGNLQSATLPDSSVVSYVYDGQRRVTTIGHANGGTTTNEYDAQSRVVRQVDPLGRATTFAYAPNATTTTDASGMLNVERYSFGQLVSVTRGDGASVNSTVSYTYGPDREVQTVTDALGRVTRYAYDGQGNRTSITDPLGRVTTATYDQFNNPLMVTNPAGETSSFTYDDRGNPLTATGPDGAETSFTINADGTVATTTDPTGRTTSYTYDAHGFLASATGPDGSTVVTSYDSLGRLISSTDARGTVPGADPADYTSTSTYDALGRLLTTTDPVGAVVALAYDAAGSPTTVTDALGATTTNEYDAAGQLVAVEDALGNRTTMTYDNSGRVMTVTDALGATTTYAYDVLGREVAVTDALGRTTHTEYDAGNRVTATITSSGARTTYAYDVADQLLTVTDPLGGVTTTTYDTAGRPVTVTDALGRAVAITYDKAGRTTSVTRADGSTLAWAYDAAGRQTSYTDATGATTRYTYDDAGRLETTTDTAGRVTSYGYDPAGHQAVVTYPDGGTATSTYDRLGRLTGTTYSGTTPATTRAYDAASRLVTATSGTSTTEYVYDAAGRPTSVSTDGASVEYAWNAGGQLSKLTYPGGNAVRYTYDAAGQLSNVSDWEDRDYQYTWTPDSQVDTLTYPNGVVTHHTYDPAGQATAITSDTSAGTQLLALAYAYDNAGQLTSQSTDRSTGPRAPPPPPPVTTSTYSWDQQGQLGQVTGLETGSYGFTATGQLTQLADGTTLTYDTAGQVTTRSTPATGQTPVQETTYSYNGLGQRTGSAGATGTTTYGYDQTGRLTSLTDPTGATSSYASEASGLRTTTTTAASTQRFVWDTTSSVAQLLSDGGHQYIYGAGSTPLAQVDTSTGAVDYLHTDLTGSVRTVTDSAGTVVADSDYTAYGTPIDVNGAPVSAVTPFGYAGQYTDPTGLLYLRARYYDPTTAQFLTIDPLVNQTRLPYGYTPGNPLQLVDPLGLDWWEALLDGNGQSIVANGLQSFGAGFLNAGLSTVNNSPIGQVAELAGWSGLHIDNPNACDHLYDWSYNIGGYTHAAAMLAAGLAAGGLGAGAEAAEAGLGAGSGPWAVGVASSEGGAVGQLTVGSCVSACGEMLSNGAVTQSKLLGQIGEWSNPARLADALGNGWRGGYFGSGADALAAAERGPMGAALQAGTGPGHMVVTSPLGDGAFLVRDPWAGGSTYTVGSSWIEQFVAGGTFK